MTKLTNIQLKFIFVIRSIILWVRQQGTGELYSLHRIFEPPLWKDPLFTYTDYNNNKKHLTDSLRNAPETFPHISCLKLKTLNFPWLQRRQKIILVNPPFKTVSSPTYLDRSAKQAEVAEEKTDKLHSTKQRNYVKPTFRQFSNPHTLNH